MRLLLVEDNVALADSLCSVLKRAGYAVDWRTDGRDAVVLGEQEPYDLAILKLAGGLFMCATQTFPKGSRVVQIEPLPDKFPALFKVHCWSRHFEVVDVDHQSKL